MKLACFLQAFVLILCQYCLFFHITTPSLLQFDRLYSVELQGVWWIIRHCATSRKVAGSIPVGIIGIFHWQTFRPHDGSEVDAAYNRNEYQEYFVGGKGGRCLGLTTLPSSSADCLEIWQSQPPGTLRVCPCLYRDCLPLHLWWIIHSSYFFSAVMNIQCQMFWTTDIIVNRIRG